MLTRAQKEEQIATLRDKLGRATSVFVASARLLRVSVLLPTIKFFKAGGH